MINYLPQRGVIDNRIGNEDVIIIHIPAFLQYFHHVGRIIIFDFHPNYPTGFTIGKLPFYLIHKVGFNVIAFFDRNIPVSQNPEQVHTHDLDITKKLIHLPPNNFFNRQQQFYIAPLDFKKTGKILRNLHKR